MFSWVVVVEGSLRVDFRVLARVEGVVSFWWSCQYVVWGWCWLGREGHGCSFELLLLAKKRNDWACTPSCHGFGR
jgi:hypothetical protein